MKILSIKVDRERSLSAFEDHQAVSERGGESRRARQVDERKNGVALDEEREGQPSPRILQNRIKRRSVTCSGITEREEVDSPISSKVTQRERIAHRRDGRECLPSNIVASDFDCIGVERT